MKLNRDQIIKALNCCTNPNADANCSLHCPFGDINACKQYVMYLALSLIKELTVELEAMRGTANSYKRLSVDLAKQVGALKDELAKRPEPLIITKLPKKKK